MARTQSRSRASKLARLVNSEASMTRFRELYRVPPSIRLAYCNLDDFPVINKDEILLSIMAVVEGGVRFPLHPLLGEESRTLCHLKAKNVHQKLVNGLPDTNKGYDKDYLRVSGDWFTESKCWSDFGYPDPSRIALYEGQADTELVKRVLATNIYVDQRGEPRSAPLLLRYEPQIRSFLEGPTVPRSQKVRVEASVPGLAVPADTTTLSEDPEFIPIGQVSEMALSINPFELMGKAIGGSSSGATKGKGKGRGRGAGKKSTKVVSESSSSEQTAQTTAQELPRPLPVVHEIDESDHGEDLAPQRKKGRSEVPPMPAEGTSASFEAWVPNLLFGDGPISVHDTVLVETETELSAHVAHGLARAACLPGDMNQWDSMNSGQIFRHVTRGMMMGILSMESRVVNMTQELQKKGTDYKRLKDQRFINVNLMKEAEERARTEEEKRKKIEVELTEQKERVRKLESECIASIERARIAGIEEGKAEGKKLGHDGAMEEARTQFRMVCNSGFRRGWKSALTKTEQPETSELFLRSNTPIPYPEGVLEILKMKLNERKKTKKKMTKRVGKEEGRTACQKVHSLPRPKEQ
uniref:Uncharacterized protein n=1 Tax=Fagus sylvatica TaxID=28930 RepID=A0A2N9EDV9_FAGSY